MTVTLQQLFQGTSTLRDKIRDTAAFGIVQVAGSPTGVLGNTIGIEAKFNALTDKSRSYYRTMIVFFNNSFTFTEDAEHSLKIEVFPGTFIYSAKPSLDKTAVGVRCTCADYYYTWWYYNKMKGGLVGDDMPKYRRVTPDSGRGPRNPGKTPGCCKHILVMADHLATKGWLQA